MGPQKTCVTVVPRSAFFRKLVLWSTTCLVEQAAQPDLFGRHPPCRSKSRATQKVGDLRVSFIQVKETEMGYKSALRSLGAMARRAERDSIRRHNELARQRKQYEKMAELEMAAFEVAEYENQIEQLTTIHPLLSG